MNDKRSSISIKEADQKLAILMKDIHHNIRNALHAINIVSEALGRVFNDNPEIMCYVERITQQVSEMKQYMNSLPKHIDDINKED